MLQKVSKKINKIQMATSNYGQKHKGGEGRGGGCTWYHYDGEVPQFW